MGNWKPVRNLVWGGQRRDSESGDGWERVRLARLGKGSEATV
jgi:hypothetical protein